ncbi:MAG: hypothetical protein AAFX78_08600 [Cyanobacteria bacterium J06638_20]
MQYLLMDVHRRFVGTFHSATELVIGDTVQGESAQNYAVIGIDWEGQNRESRHSATVIPTAKSATVSSM